MKRFLRDYGVLVALVVLFLVNALVYRDPATGQFKLYLLTHEKNTFLATENLRNLFSQNAYVGIIAIGMTFVVMTAGIDLSVGSMLALCGTVGVLALNKQAMSGATDGRAILIALLASVAVGIVAGLLNGVAIAYGRVAPFIVTLAGLAGFRSIAQVLGSGGEVRSQVATLQEIGFGGIDLPFLKTQTGGALTIFWSLIAFLALALVASFILNYTRFGRYIIAVGANERAARYSAINTQTVKLAAYGLVGCMVGIAAFLNAARMNSVGTGSAGVFYELDAIAAVVIGGTSLRGGKGRIWGTVVGIVLLTLIGNMMTAYRIDTNWQGLVKGGVILVAVLLQRGSKANE